MLQIFRDYFFFKIRDKRIFSFFRGGGWGWGAVEVILEDSKNRI